MMKLIACLAIILATTVSSKTLPFRDCAPGAAGNATNFEIVGCDGTEICQLKRGQKLSLTVNYQANEDQSEPKFTLFARWRGSGGMISAADLQSVLKPFDTNACHSTPCPIRKGVAQRLTFNTTIPTDFYSDAKLVELSANIEQKFGYYNIFCSAVTVNITG